MKIVGNLISSKQRPAKQYLDNIVQELWQDNIKITISKVAEVAKTSRYMVKWYFDDNVIQKIQDLNVIIKETNLISKAIEAIY